jgi:hypothetical protein
VAGYIILQTYAQLPTEPTLQATFQTYMHFLEKIGYKDNRTSAWLSTFTWNDLESYGFAGTSSPREIVVAGQELLVTPGVNGFVRTAMPKLNIPWVELNLLFKGEHVTYSPHDWKYRPDAGASLWKLMLEFSALFMESGTYLLDEAHDGQPWYALLGADGELWSFDLALVPNALLPCFSSMPGSYQRGPSQNVLVHTRAWPKMPWMEADQLQDAEANMASAASPDQ